MNDLSLVLLQLSPLARLERYFESALVHRAVWGLPMPVVLGLLAVVVIRAVIKTRSHRGGNR